MAHLVKRHGADERLQWAAGARLSSLVVCATLLLGCATQVPRACVLTTKPHLHRQPISWHLVDVTVLAPIERLVDVSRTPRRLLGHPKSASDLGDGRILPGSFFTNRDITSMTPEAIRWGPTDQAHLATPPLTITRMKGEGKTRGFFIRDAKGDAFLLKFDFPEYPELLTGAEVATSKLMHALGYYVPSYEIIEVPVDQLLIPSGSSVTHAEVDSVLAGRVRDGHARACASRILEGELLGPFRFKQYRDLAELRALKLAYAWVNNTDAKDHNSLMVWTGQQAIGYLIDFGSAFGANADHGPKQPCQGWMYDVDLGEWVTDALTLGWRHGGCDTHEHPASPAVGLFSPRLDPVHWKPYAPNLAFAEITAADAQWMATRIGQFSHAQLEAAVSAGQYTHPEDAARILEVLEKRRAAILAAYPAGAGSLGSPAVTPSIAPTMKHAPSIEVSPRSMGQ